MLGWFIFALWLTLVAYWGLAAAAMKRQLGTRWIWWREIAVRLAFFSLVMVILRADAGASASQYAWLYGLNTSAAMGLIGFALCALGIGLAILGRSSLGRNWPMPNSNYDNTELVTTGPYAYVRHPIYGGMLLAILGSAIAQSLLWLVPLVIYGPYFIRSARYEEKFLIEHFPELYRSYMTRTKMLLPFVL
jgi:protein-S-isoprenylcysteine O-methyltransferase Ste14